MLACKRKIPALHASTGASSVELRTWIWIFVAIKCIRFVDFTLLLRDTYIRALTNGVYNDAAR
jgi:hypothetical protein